MRKIFNPSIEASIIAIRRDITELEFLAMEVASQVEETMISDKLADLSDHTAKVRLQLGA